jgi:hypothetical protein
MVALLGAAAAVVVSGRNTYYKEGKTERMYMHGWPS